MLQVSQVEIVEQFPRTPSGYNKPGIQIRVRVFFQLNFDLLVTSLYLPDYLDYPDHFVKKIANIKGNGDVLIGKSSNCIPPFSIGNPGLLGLNPTHY